MGLYARWGTPLYHLNSIITLHVSIDAQIGLTTHADTLISYLDQNVLFNDVGQAVTYQSPTS